MLTLEQVVLATLEADATLTALIPAANMTGGEVWNLPADAAYPHISVASAIEKGAGPADDPGALASKATIWIESMVSRAEAKQIEARVVKLLHRRPLQISTSYIGVYMIKLSGSPVMLREPRTGANQVVLNFDVVAQ